MKLLNGSERLESGGRPSRPPRAGISTFDSSRYMGASLTMLDHHYGHPARDGHEHAIRLLDELGAGERPPWTLVDAAWTPKATAAASGDNGSSA